MTRREQPARRAGRRGSRRRRRRHDRGVAAAEPPGDADGAADEEPAEASIPRPAAPEPAGDLEGPRRRGPAGTIPNGAPPRSRRGPSSRTAGEVRRRVQGKPADEAKRLSRGTVRGLKVLVWFIVVSVVSVGLGLILYFTPLMSARFDRGDRHRCGHP